MTQMGLFADTPAASEPMPAATPVREDMTTSPLVLTLRLAVPMWIDRAAERGFLRDVFLEEWRVEAADIVASEGDDILYVGHRRGDSARAFNALARGVAALAYQPGGVTAFGLTWCAWHSPAGVACDGPPCARCCADELRVRLVCAMRRLIRKDPTDADEEFPPGPEGDFSDRMIGEGDPA